MTPADPRWLRWQLTQRGGLLWHETCATCQNWQTDDGDWGECCEAMAPRGQTEAEQACSLSHQMLLVEEITHERSTT